MALKELHPLAIDDVGLVGQSIKKGRRHDRVAKDLCPVGKAGGLPYGNYTLGVYSNTEVFLEDSVFEVATAKDRKRGRPRSRTTIVSTNPEPKKLGAVLLGPPA